MATEEEVRLGRLVVQRKHATEAQVVDALRERNARPKGPDLAAVLEARGLLTSELARKLRDAVAKGEGLSPALARDEASTDHEISLGSTREVIARDQLEEALRAAKAQPKMAYRELRRLAKEFRDTESGVRAEREAGALEAKHPEVRG
jgi:hypothetical protein